MRYFKYIFVIIFLVVLGLLSSCETVEVHPHPVNILDQLSDSDDDEDPIIIRDSTNVN